MTGDSLAGSLKISNYKSKTMNNTSKIVQVVMLPTENPSQIYKARTGGLGYYNEPKTYTVPDQGQYLYFTTDEPIQEGDWYTWKDGTIRKSTRNNKPRPDCNGYKVVASTDPALGLPAIPKTWIKDVFVPSNGSIKEVELETFLWDYVNQDDGVVETTDKLKLTDNNEVCIVSEIQKKINYFKSKFQTINEIADKTNTKFHSVPVPDYIHSVTEDPMSEEPKTLTVHEFMHQIKHNVKSSERKEWAEQNRHKIVKTTEPTLLEDAAKNYANAQHHIPEDMLNSIDQYDRKRVSIIESDIQQSISDFKAGAQYQKEQSFHLIKWIYQNDYIQSSEGWIQDSDSKPISDEELYQRWIKSK